MLVSVIIPTYQRPDSVQRTLTSLSQQTLSPQHFEVFVVIDGFSIDPVALAKQNYPFSLSLLSKPREGATLARNYGALESRGEVLVFMDDDVTISRETLQTLATACMENQNILATGRLIASSETSSNPFTQISLQMDAEQAIAVHDEYLNFASCNTQLLAAKRSDFFSLAMFQDPSGGWPNWDDVDFGYRAHLRGYKILRCAKATGYHWDYSLSSFESACERWRRASKSAVRLFEQHPGLYPHIPMYHDKTPIQGKYDRPGLIFRKIIRRLASSYPVIWMMERMIKVLENSYPLHWLLRRLYLWTAGGYMLRGYREGLLEYKRSKKRA